jgi:hypothetical protein
MYDKDLNTIISFVSIKILEIGAGNISVGQHSGQFTTQLHNNKYAQDAILHYANQRLPRPWKGKYNHVISLSSDRIYHRHIHFKIDVTKIQFPERSFHFVISIGPKYYGFRNEFTGYELLKEIRRILLKGGEFHIFGNYENPWFNMYMGSKDGQKIFKRVVKKTGFKLLNFFQPIKLHPWYGIFRGNTYPITTLSCLGKYLKPPTHFHLLAKK